eukprot:4603692-Pyramimonas_sp.AAC.1
MGNTPQDGAQTAKRGPETAHRRPNMAQDIRQEALRVPNVSKRIVVRKAWFSRTCVSGGTPKLPRGTADARNGPK